MQITIEQDKCVGCGRCTEICPDVFKLSTEGKSQIMAQTNFECAKRAGDECPVEAIHVHA